MRSDGMFRRRLFFVVVGVALIAHMPGRMLAMVPGGEKDRYQPVIPAEHVVPTWDLMYLIEVIDNQGNGKIHPDLNKETPYVVVRLVR